MIWSYVLVNLAVILLAARLRYAHRGLEYASPVSLSPGAWWWAIAAVAVAAAAAAWLGRRRLRDKSARRALAELAVLPAFFAYEWGRMPHFLSLCRWYDVAFVGGIIAVMVVLQMRDWKDRREWGLGRRNFVPAARVLAVPTALMIAAPVAAAFFVGTEFDPVRTVSSVLTYPLYSLLQLLVLQLFLVPRLRRVSDSAAAVVASAAIFALAHWPNAVVMGACFVGAAVWTAVYLLRPNVYASALSMGLAATALISALPRERALQNLRIGPIYVQRLVEGKAVLWGPTPGRSR